MVTYAFDASMMAGMRFVSSVAASRRSRPSAGLDRSRVPLRAERLHPVDLLALERRVDVEELELLFVGLLVTIDADDHALSGLDLALVAERRLGDLALEEVLLDGRDDSAELADPVEVLVRLRLEPVRQLLDEVGAAERVDRRGDTRSRARSPAASGARA